MQTQNNKWIYLIYGGIILFIIGVIYINLIIFNTHITALKNEMLEQLGLLSSVKSTQLYVWETNVKKSIDYFIRAPYLDDLNFEDLKKQNENNSIKLFERSADVIRQHGFIDGINIIDTNLNVINRFPRNKEIKISSSIKLLVKKIKKKFLIDNAAYIKKKKNINNKVPPFLYKVDDTNFEIINNTMHYNVITMFTKKTDNGYKLLGYYIFSTRISSAFAILLKPHSIGKKMFSVELIKTYNYQPNKVIRIVPTTMGSYKIEYGISNIPLFYLPKQYHYSSEKNHLNYFEGFDRDNELVLANLTRRNMNFFLLTKINLKEFSDYKQIFALYLFGLTLIIIIGSFILFYIFKGYFKNANYKKEYELLVERQAYQIRYETLLKNANDAIVLYDKTGRILEYNDKFAAVFGFENKKSVNLTIDRIWAKESYINEKDVILNNELFYGKLFESLNVDKNFKVFPVEVSIRSVKIENLTFNQAIIRDISERKNNEIALTESKEKYKNLVENINDVLFTIDRKGIVKYISPVIYNITGFTEDEILNHNFYDFLTINEREKALEIKDALLTKENNTSIISLQKKSGELCYVKVSTRLNKPNKGDLIITGVLTDVTYEKELELMLEKERSDLKTIIDLSPVAIYFKDRYNNYIKVNKAAALISNSEVESIQGKSAREIFPNTHDIYYKEDIEIMTSGMPKFAITEKLDINGRLVWLRSDKVPWYNEKGEVAGIICFSVDITEQINAENDLLREKELLQWILKTIPVGVVYINKNGEILLGNSAAEKIFELSFDSIEKYTYFSSELKLYEPDGNEVADEENPFNSAFSKNNQIKDRELCFYKKDGNMIILSINISLINDKTGNIEGLVGSIEDITKRKEYEKALKESELRYRSLFESMQEGFGLHEIICDNNGKPIDYRFLEINPSFERLTGLKSSEIINKTAKEVLPNLEDFWIEQYGKIALKPSYTEFESFSNDLGKYFKVSAFSVVKGIFAVLFEDITDKKKIEQELELHRQNLEIMVKVRTQELNKSNIMLGQEIEKGRGTEMMLKRTLEEVQRFSDLKTRFISTASHEFRTPLTTISSSIQLLRDYGKKWDNFKYVQHIERILRTIDNLTDLINDVLLVSRVESGKIEFNPSLEDLNLFCLKLIDELKNDFAKNHIIDYTYRADRKEYFIDIKLLRSILTNLLTNAIKYSSVGEVIKVIIESNESFVKLLIIDNGIGISGDDLEHLFEPFHRGKNVADINGTGLGMSIIKRYVEVHQGNIEVKSELNKGTTVKLNIPILLPEKVKDEGPNN